MGKEQTKVRDTRACKAYESKMHAKQMSRNMIVMLCIFIICVLDAIFGFIGTSENYTLFIPGLFGILSFIGIFIPQVMDLKAIKKENLKYQSYDTDLTKFINANKGFTTFIGILSALLVIISIFALV